MKRLLLIAFLSGMLGCAPATVSGPAPPNSAQTQVANIDKALADANNAAVKLAIALRDQGKVSAATTATIENWSARVAQLDDQIASELGGADPWTTQKQKIGLLLAGFALPNIAGSLDPTLQADLVAVGNLLSQIQGQVSQ